MYTLASTADIYLSPALETIVTAWGCSDSLAGVTLLAFGNGAPDVFSAIAAAKSSDNSGDQPNCTLAVSVIFGGTTFITCLVMLASTLSSNLNKDDPKLPKDRRIIVTPKFFTRDVIFLMIANIYLLVIFLFVHKLTMWTSIGLLLIYAVYVVIVVM